MASVLNGIRVLDLSSGIAGPIAGMLLADHGADVVKIEPPGGDPLRSTPGYRAWLRGRRSAVLDLHHSGDREDFYALARGADVVIESFAQGTATRLGVDADTLCAANPRLIHCSISAYGRHSAHNHRPGYDALVAARLGIWHEQRGHFGGAVNHMNGLEPFLPDLEIPEGMEPGSPREGPIFTYTPWLSMGTAFLATMGVSAALYARERTDRGQRVETSLLQAAMIMTASKWQKAARPEAKGYATWTYDRRATKGMFRCADGRWVQHWVPNPNFVLSSSQGDRVEWAPELGNARDDPQRIPTGQENIIVLAHYYPQMAEAVARFPSDQWIAAAAAANTPLQPVRTPEEALNDAALIAEGAVVEIDHPEHGRLRQAGILYGLSETPGQVQGPVPTVGQHTAEIKAEAKRTAPERTPSDPRTQLGQPITSPLDGITVLDLGFAVAGPFGTQVLADLGANVIKVNAYRDPFWHATHIAYGANRGKRSVGIDLKTSEGLLTFYELVKRADVVHSNMRRGALKRLEVDEGSLRKINPDIIYCHTRGFDRGPRSNSPGNDQTGCSLAGVTYEDGGTADGGKPFWSLTSLGDTGNGFLSAIGVIQALYHRARTKQAQSVDTSIINAGLLCASQASIKADGTPLPRYHLDGMQLGLGATYRLYPTTDGWVCLAAVTDDHWQALVKALGQPVWAADARFADAAGRAEHRKALEALIEPFFGERTAAAAFTLLDDHGVPTEIANGHFGEQIYADPEADKLGLVVRQSHPKVGLLEMYGVSIDFSDTPGRIEYPPPICGQHTREILREAGFDDERIDELLATKAIFENLWVD